MLPPEGDRPGGEEPFEGIPPEDLERGEEVRGDLPDLEPEFVEALREAEQAHAEESESAAEQPPAEEPEPTTPEPAAEDPEPATEQPSAEQPEPAAEEPPAEEEAPAEEPEAAPEEPAEDAEPAMGGAAAQPSPEQPTVEFTQEEVSEAKQPSEDKDTVGDEKPTPSAPPPPATPAQPATPAPPAVPSAVSAGTGIPQKPPPDGDSEQAPKRKRLWMRFALGSFVVVASVAASVAASILLEVKGIAEALQPIPKVKRLLQGVEGGEPENILILGSDKRASLPGSKGLSDTTILLRLDPDNNAIALMSIPRDLKTYVPGVGVTKFNAAYAYGGPKLTLRVVKRITGLPINHVVNVDFLGFIRAINAINCVYVDVDRRYYHSNLGLPPSLQYAEINIPAGYQRLCGKDALEYVRYRHTDTDLVRAARQQDFLREARQRVPVGDLVLPGQRDELIDIFTRYTSSDIDGLRTMLDVLDLFIASRNAPIKEIHFPALLHPSYVTASKPAIDAAVEKFLGIEASGGPRGALDLPSSSGNTGIVPEQRKRARKSKNANKEEKAPPTPSPGNDGLVDASQFSHDLAAKVAARTLRSFPVFYPRRLPSGSIYVQVPRVYHLRDSDGNSRGAYKEVLQLPQGDYFGLQGVHGWSDPPILSHPSESRTIMGREYDIFLDGDRVRLISWHQGDNAYWVSNSLLQTLSNDQMLGIARSVGKVPGQRSQRKKAKG
jgi:polyisoprenyl-teichoic acid--peptidoglycan teichoic acid transferase